MKKNAGQKGRDSFKVTATRVAYIEAISESFRSAGAHLNRATSDIPRNTLLTLSCDSEPKLHNTSSSALRKVSDPIHFVSLSPSDNELFGQNQDDRVQSFHQPMPADPETDDENFSTASVPEALLSVIQKLSSKGVTPASLFSMFYVPLSSSVLRMQDNFNLPFKYLIT